MKLLGIRLIRKDERGASMLEYALLASLIAVVAIAGVSVIGKKTKNSFNATGYAIASGVSAY